MKKCALVHDWLFQIAGAEKVLDSMYRSFPGDIYTLFSKPSRESEEFLKGANITPSFLQKVPGFTKFYRHLLPFYPQAIESFDLTDYDVILSSSHAVANKVLTHCDQLHISYCHTPMRYIWDLSFEYFRGVRSLLKKAYIKRVLHKLRNWDVLSASRVDHFIANSHYIARRIRKIYGREAEVIYPPVDVNRFQFEREKEDYFLTVSRLVPYKKIDLIVRAFNEMPNKKLIVVGDGPARGDIASMARANVDVRGRVSDEELNALMSKAKGFVFAAVEDFGISPVEAMATGTPVVALGRGGTKETVIHEKTGIHFDHQTEKAIIDAVEFFETRSWDPYDIRSHAEQFSSERFDREYQSFVEKKIEEFRGRDS